MKKPGKPTTETTLLRQKAEETLRHRPAKTPLQLYEADDLKLIHELEVHQVELEMQNEELAAAISAARDAIALYDFAPAGYFTLSRDGAILKLNLSGAAMLGNVRSKLENSLFHFFISDDTKPAFRLFLREVFTHGDTTSCEVVLVVQEKLPLNVFITGKKIMDEEQCLITVVDITGRKQAEVALKDENLRLELVMHAANVAWWEMDVTSGNVTFGKRKAEMLGYPPERFRHYTDFMALVHPDDYEKVMNAMYAHISGEIGKYEAEYRIITQSDGYKWFYDIGSVVKSTSEGKPLRVSGLVIDITGRKQAEETVIQDSMRHRAILHTAMDGFWLADIQGNLLEVNETYCKMSGYSERELLTMHISDLESGESREEIAERIKLITEYGESRFESRHRRKDRSLWEVEVSVQFQPADGGRLVSFIHDISERKMAEQELRQAKEQAEESDRLKTAFLSNISHEIRTPMNGIIGFAELLKRPDLTGEQQQDFLRIIKKSSDRMLNTINNIVDISKIETGQMKLALSETNINEQVEFICNFFKTETDIKGITLSFNNGLLNNLANIITDRPKIYAILTSLLSNAIKFTKNGRIEIGYDMVTVDPLHTVETLHATSLHATSLHATDLQLQFYVKDTGIGVPLNRQQAIFERFMQADISDTRAFQGAGLGLSISKAYVEMLGGRIWVESNPATAAAGSDGEGKGSVFYFTIPYIAATNQNPVNGNAVPIVKTSKENKKLKVLIVDDDDVSELLILVACKPFSDEIFRVQTGNDAVEVCRNHPDIDLVMMDIKLPEMDGYQATRQIRRFNSKVVVIAQTAFGMTGDREKATAAGCNDYIPKPINLALLKKMIQKHCYE
jgi:PAS domain S-box-containing protein